MSYNLDEGVQEGFEFVLGGNTYLMTYPTTEQIEDLKKEKDDEKRGKQMFGFIKATTDGAPDIEEALKKKNVKVLQKFYKMIQTEMGMDQ